MTTHATSDSDLPLERLKLCATGCDVCTVYGEDVEYALSLIASLRVCCDERGAALEAIQRGARKCATCRHQWNRCESAVHEELCVSQRILDCTDNAGIPCEWLGNSCGAWERKEGA